MPNIDDLERRINHIKRIAKRAFIVFTLIGPLLMGSLIIPVKDQAVAFPLQAETIRGVIYDPNGGSGMPHLYSDGTTVKYLEDLNQVPPDARWVTFMSLYDLDEGTEFYYSRDGITTEKKYIRVYYWNDIPADVKWLTVSNFDGGFGDKNPIHNQQYTYSVDGVTVMSGPEVPANAVWATLSYYTTTWSNNDKALNYSKSRASYTLDVDPVRTVSIHSDAESPNYAKAGNKVTLSFTSLKSLQSPVVTLAGQTVTAVPEASGTEWKATVTLNTSHPEGAIAFRIAYQDGNNPRSVTATTDGSSVFFDETPPVIALTPSTVDWTKDNVVVTGRVDDTGSGVEIRKWAEGNRDAAYFHNEGSHITGDAFTASSNGWYTWYAKDRAGNESVQKIEIQNIDRVPPSLTLELTPKDWTSAAVQISAAALDDRSGISVEKWASGTQSEAFFQSGGGTVFSNSFAVTDNGTYTVYAEDKAGNGLTKEIIVQNFDNSPPDIILTPSSTVPTKGDVTITVDASDQGSGVEIRKWAAGQRDPSYFANAGTKLQGASFTVSENDTYTVYAKDYAGNESVETLKIGNIYKIGSSVRLTLASPNWSNQPMSVQVHVTDNGSGIAEQKWAAGEHDVSYFTGAGTPFGGTSFTVNENGTYTVYVKDNAGYEDLASIEVTHLDEEKPTIAEPALSPDTWTNGEVTVTVSALDNSGVISVLKWSTGMRDEAFFQNGGGTVFTDSFISSENGDYTIYAEDAAGNGITRSFHVTTIDKDVPVIELRPSTELPTNRNVTVTADVYNTQSPVLNLKWAPGTKPLSYFDREGTSFNGSFEAELNGWYTVYAESAAGNKQIKTIEITNIFKEVPVIQLAVSPTIPTQAHITVTASVYSPSPLVERKLAFGQRDPAYFQTEGESWSDHLEVSENGWVSYYVKDQAGNETVKQLEITNIDREKPVITLLGNPAITVVQNTVFIDPGAAAHDNLDGDITDRIKVTGKVEPSKPGVYTLRYAVSDHAGNEAEEKIRTVTVRPRPDEDNSGPSAPSPESGGTGPGNSTSDPNPNNPGAMNPSSGHQGGLPDKTIPDKTSKETSVITDIAGHWAETEIRGLQARKLVEGYPDGTFRPNRPITRAEFIALLVRGLKLEGQGGIPFKDAANHWASQAIHAAYTFGLVEGYDNGFLGPNDPITREQMAVMLAKAGQHADIFSNVSNGKSFKDHDTIAVWAKEHIAAVVESRLMNGYPNGRFLPKGTATRAEAVTVMFRLLEFLERDK